MVEVVEGLKEVLAQKAILRMSVFPQPGASPGKEAVFGLPGLWHIESPSSLPSPQDALLKPSLIPGAPPHCSCPSWSTAPHSQDTSPTLAPAATTACPHHTAVYPVLK